MDQGLPQGESPIDMPEDDARGGIGWACGVIVTSSLALLAFNSHALANWADQLPVVPATAPVVNLADDWHARAETLGLNTVVDRVEQAAGAMRKAQWPAERLPAAKTRAPE
jgi:hypothetical protein